jgi:WD40 repeat protein
MGSGSRLVSASDKAIIWDVTGGGAVAVLDNHQGAISEIAVSPDGGRIAAGTADGAVRLWRSFVTSEQLVSDVVEIVPRCLTHKEREENYLARDESPAWCAAKGKWPYATESMSK